MSGTSTGTSTPNGVPQQTKKGAGKREVKILMLHGYTQSGQLFHAKTRALEKLLIKTLAPVSILPVLIYPTGPNRLRPEDIPGFEEALDGGSTDKVPSDSWAWYRKGVYDDLHEGMAVVEQAIRDADGIDGVCGFSQGAALTGIITAALEPSRSFTDEPVGDWVRKLREANGGKPLEFAVSYSGFCAPVDTLQWLYNPKIKTPMMHFIGSLDTVVEESRSQALVDACEEPVVVVHPGGHHVPVSKEWVMPLAGFIKSHAGNPVEKPAL